MLTRLYIHNFRTFVNFEVRFDGMRLLMGPNGAGKTALMEVLDRLRQLICESARIHYTFPMAERSAGLAGTEAEMRFELDMADASGGLYTYGLEIEVDRQRGLPRVGREWLHHNGMPLFAAERGEAQLYRDNHSAGPAFPMDWSLSGVGFLMRSPDNRRLSAFKEQLNRLHFIRIQPGAMSDESRAEASRPDTRLGNFADWYRHLSLAMPERLHRLTEDLRARLPGLLGLRFREAGDGKLLFADFEAEAGDQVSLRFGVLSEGQKALIGLYTVLRALPGGEGAVLCIDEPENFLALPEIQPWLDQLSEVVEDEECQVLLISHHPRLLNFLAAEQGLWLERPGGSGPTRVRPIGVNTGQRQLAMDELIERGWIHGAG